MSIILTIFIFGTFLVTPGIWTPVAAATEQVPSVTQVAKSDTETFSAEELEEIARAIDFKRRSNTEEEIIDSVTKRFTWIGVLVAIVGLFGITAITNLLLTPVLNRTRDAASKANAEVEVAARTIEQMRSAAIQAKEDADASLNRANEQREIVSKIVSELSEKAANLDKRFNSIQANAENVRDQLEQSFTALDERLTKLANEIPEAADEQNALRKASEAKLGDFKENSEYEIHFSVYGNTEVPILIDLMEHFRSLGFKITGAPEPDLNTNSPSQQNRATLAYTRKGKEKAKQVADELMTFAGIEIELDSSPSDSNLMGDLQVGFQRGS